VASSGPASALSFRAQPTGSIRASLVTPIVIEIRDGDGSLVTSGPDASALVSLQVEFGVAGSTGSLVRNAVAGVADFSDVQFLYPGYRVLRATKADTTGVGGTSELQVIGSMFEITHSRQVAAMGAGYCYRHSNGELKCWGHAHQLGFSDAAIGDESGEVLASSSVNLGTGETVNSVLTGAASTRTHALAFSQGYRDSGYNSNFTGCAILTNGMNGHGPLKCWGTNTYGELGQGDTLSRGYLSTQMGSGLTAVNLGAGLTAKQVRAGQGFTCAHLSNDQVKCWGTNWAGQLGLGDTTALTAPLTGAGSWIDLAGTPTQISVGRSHVCAIMSCTSIRCWGNNEHGQLGDGNTSNRGDAAGEMGSGSQPLQSFSGVGASQISAGADFTCAVLTSDGSARCWGHNQTGQLGRESTANYGGGVGENLSGLAGSPINLGTGLSVKQISAGTEHVCVVLEDAANTLDDRVKCWGSNYRGELGIGDTWPRGRYAGEMGDSLPVVDLGSTSTVTQVSAGYYHSCALLTNGQVKCWGSNSHGQLGLGDVANRGDAAGEMGDNLPAVNLG